MRKLVNKVKNKIVGKPTGDAYYNDKAKKYEKNRAKTEVWQREQNYMKYLLSEMDNELKVMDVPFGTGRFVPFYLEKKMKIYGFDSSIDMVDVAKNNLGVDFKACQVDIGDATKPLPYDTNSFDLVVVCRFLQGTVEYGKVKIILEEISRISSKYVILTLSERSRLLPRFNKPNINKKMSNQLYPDEVNNLLKEKGLAVIKKGKLRKSYYSTHCMYLCEILNN